MTQNTPTKTFGITFRETMAGNFALGIQKPRLVNLAHSHGVHRLAMHVTVSIDDIDGFISDPGHLGSLTGTIDFAPLGAGLPAHTGIFNLFSPTTNQAETHMIYELGFTHEGQEYYIAGHKQVRDDPGLDLWSDTTTLYTTLHRGTDKNGEVAGAGILTLGLTDLIKLATTVRATNADSAAERAQAIGKFGKFFMGELWQTYGPKF